MREENLAQHAAEFVDDLLTKTSQFRKEVMVKLFDVVKKETDHSFICLVFFLETASEIMKNAFYNFTKDALRAEMFCSCIIEEVKNATLDKIEGEIDYSIEKALEED